MTYSKEKWKEIIITDYLDGQLDENARSEVEEAMAKDTELQEYWEVVKKTAQEPFQDLPEEIPPERLWTNIKTEIESEQVLQPWWEDTLERIKGWGARPRLNFALANVMVVLIVAVWVNSAYLRSQRTQIDVEQQVDY